MDISFVMAGSGAVRVNARRGGPAYVLSVDGRALLFDCGRCAVHNVEMLGFPPQGIDRVFVTHLHFDHTCDLPYFLLLAWNNGRRGKARLYGPPGLASFLEHSVRRAYADDISSRLAHGKDPAGLEWEAVEIDEDGPFLDEKGWRVSALRTPHAGLHNLNYRVDVGDRSVVITSDTQPDKALASFCRLADLLVCECSGTAEFLRAQPWGGWHMTPQSVGRLAAEAGVRRVVLKHFVIENFTDDPDIAEKMAAEIRKEYHGEVIAGSDGMRIDL